MNSKYIFFLFYCTLFANLTSLYFPLSTHLRLPLQLQGVCYIISCLLVLFFERNRALRLIQNFWMIGLFVLIVLIPFCSIFYTPHAQLREVALVVLFYALIFATAITVQTRGWYEMWRLLEITLIINIIALAVSFIFPFQFIALFSGGAHEYVLGQGRAPGLFVNGNQSAKVITILTVAWLAFPRSKIGIFRFYGIIFSAFCSIAMTGSRSSILVFSFLAAVSSIHFIFTRRGMKVNFFKIYFVAIPILLPLFLIVFILVLKVITPFLSDEFTRYNQDNLTSRLNKYTQGPAVIYEDLIEAASGRFNVSAPYWEAALKSPYIGHGVRSMFAMRYYSGLELISHNTFVTFAYEYGIPYMVIFFLFLIFLLKLPCRKNAENYFAQPLLKYFVFIVMLFYMTIGTGHELRPIWIVLGCILGLMLSPPKHIEKVMSRR